MVGEAKNENDINEWANKLDNSWILAGAGDFYDALLSKQIPETKAASISPVAASPVRMRNIIQRTKRIYKSNQ